MNEHGAWVECFRLWKTEELTDKSCLFATLSTANPTWAGLGLNPHLHSETNYLNHGMACLCTHHSTTCHVGNIPIWPSAVNLCLCFSALTILLSNLSLCSSQSVCVFDHIPFTLSYTVHCHIPFTLSHTQRRRLRVASGATAPGPALEGAPRFRPKIVLMSLSSYILW